MLIRRLLNAPPFKVAQVIATPTASIPSEEIVTAAPTFAVLVTNVVTIPVGALNVVIYPVFDQKK